MAVTTIDRTPPLMATSIVDEFRHEYLAERLIRA